MSRESQGGYDIALRRTQDERRALHGLKYERLFLVTNDYNRIKLRYFKYQYEASCEMAQSCQEILHSHKVSLEQQRTLNEQLKEALEAMPKWKAKWEKQERKWQLYANRYKVRDYSPSFFWTPYQPPYKPTQTPTARSASRGRRDVLDS
jgi:hypothetical protein